MNDKRIVTKARLDGAAKGSLEAVISTFDVVDSQGDVVLASAFTDGQAVPLVWSHRWDKPIGDGKIRVERTRAVFVGRLWLDTDDGEQAYRKIKNAGPLQEYSWGFEVLAAEPATRDGVPVRLIQATRVYEASPVLVGAGVGTQTLAIKGGMAGQGRRAGAGLATPERAELRAIFARLDEQRARERREVAELAVSVQRTLARTAHIATGGRRRG